MIIVDDDLLGRHLGAALRTYIRELRRDGISVPKAVAELEIAVRGGQGRSTVDAAPEADDHDRVDQLAMSYRRAAARLDVSDSTLRRLIAAGEIAVVRVGGATRIRSVDLESYVAGLTPVVKEAA